MQNKPLFELEQQIFQCWNLVDDIKMLSEAVGEEALTADQLPKLLEGLSDFYQLKFSRLFAAFEDVIKSQN